MGLSGRDLIKAWALPVLLALVALAFDAADRRVPFTVLTGGALDEGAHLATGALGLLALSCFIDVPRRFYVAGLIASVAIDLDHIPMYLGVANPNERPVTHSLATVVVVLIAAVASRRHRAVLAGVATGLLIHFARDIAEGPPGVRMLWPLSNTAWTASFRWFLGMIIAFTVVRLVLVTLGVPQTRIRLFQELVPARSSPPIARAAPADSDPDPETEGSAREGASESSRTLPTRDTIEHLPRTDLIPVPPPPLVSPSSRSSHPYRQAGKKRHDVTWLTALVLSALALPALLARLGGGYPPNPVPQLAALAPLAVVPAIVAVIVAVYAAWWLAVLLAIPAALLVRWQLPAPRRAPVRAAEAASRGTASAAMTLRLRLFTVNAQDGAADPAVILRIVRQHDVDVLTVQELTPLMVARLAAVGLTQVLPFSHLDPRPGSQGTGLWARWPLAPLPPVPGLTSAAPRARIDPLGGLPVTLTAVHPLSPVYWRADRWRRELALIQQALTAVDEPQVVAGDFNATRDHGPFRELLAAGFLDCADVSQNRSWPGFTWPSLPVMHLDHVLVSRAAAVPMARVMRVPRTDHHGVLADIEFTLET
jgi:endonuclease/exonuclease/phosphatase family metal-dependent hydrolase